MANTDPSKGPVFRPSKTDYKDTFTKGAKDSKDRTQYETGVGQRQTFNCRQLPMITKQALLLALPARAVRMTTRFERLNCAASWNVLLQTLSFSGLQAQTHQRFQVCLICVLECSSWCQGRTDVRAHVCARGAGQQSISLLRTMP